MTPSQQQYIFESIVPWLGGFCADHGFFNRAGKTNVARALNLLGGHEPKTKAERAFIAALWAEVQRRKLVMPMAGTPCIGAKPEADG